jgi:hypothetical protein
MDGRHKLPVLATARLAYRFVFGHLGSVAQVAWPWLAIVVLWNVLLATVPARAVGATGPLTTERMVLDVALNQGVTAIVLGLACIAAAVAWHRTILLGEPVSWWPRFRRHEWRYLWISILIALVMLLPAIAVLCGVWLAAPSVMAAAAQAGGLTAALWSVQALMGLASLVLLAIVSRLELALPAAAIGQRLRLGESRLRTAGNTWRLLICWLAMLGPYYVITAGVGIVLEPVMAKTPIPAQAWIVVLVSGVWTLVGAILVASTLSFAFYFLHLKPLQAAAASRAAV